MVRGFRVTIVLIASLCFGTGCSIQVRGAKESFVSTHYIAADEVDWNYAPGGVDKMMGMPFMGDGKMFTERGPHRIGTIYQKALYREYTDDTFSTLKPR